MCGFVGNYNFKNKNDKFLIKKILNKLSHRGPDQSKIIQINNFSLGFNRLSILATRSKFASQPLKIGNKILLFNGEIYNYDELSNLVYKKNENKRKFGDTEILFKLINKFGIKFTLKKIEGMFSFSWIDLNENTITLARDRIGEKPLYYFNNNETFWFSSEIKGITLSGETKGEININKINDYFANGKINGKYTFFKDIFEVEPGQFLTFNINNKKLYKKFYWKIDKNIKPSKVKKIDEARLVIRKLLTDYTKMIRVNSDKNIKIGLLLSSGVDSNVILDILYKENLLKNLDIFTAKNDQKSLDESHKVMKIIKRYNKKRKILNKPYHSQISHSENIKIIKKLSYYNDEPLPFLMSPLVYKLCEKAKKNKIKVLISGEGSDEIFFGYERYNKTLEKIKKTSESSKVIEEIFFGSGLKNKKLIEKITSIKNFKDLEGYSWLTKNINKFSKNSLQEVYRQKYTFQNLLQRNDRIGMSQSIEIRAPFLSYLLFEYANNLHLDIKMKNGFSKYVLREEFKNSFNKDVMKSNNKLPFPTTFKNFLYTIKFKKSLFSLIKKTNSFTHSYLNKDIIEEVIIKHFEKKNDYHNILWKIYSLELWYQQLDKYFFKS